MGRLKHYWESMHFLWRCVVIAFAIIGVFDTIQAQFFSLSWQQNIPRVFDVYMLAPWYIWIILILVVIIIGVLEGSYKKRDKSQSESKSGEDKFVPIYQVVEYVRNAIGDDNEEQCYPGTLIAIRQAALDGKLSMVGKAELQHKPHHHDDVAVKIDPDYWKKNKLGQLATSPAYIDHYHTTPIKYTDGFSDQRWSLQVNKNDVMAAWPNGPESAFADFMPLSAACRAAYEETQGTLAALAAEKEGGKDEILNWFANALIKTCGIALYGARPPSQKIGFIHKLGGTAFVDGAERLVDKCDANIEYINLSIKPNELDDAVQKIKLWGD